MTTVHNIVKDTDATDSNVYFRRPNGECYAVLTPKSIRSLKRKKQLDAHLQERRDSGTVINIVAN